MLPSNKPLKLPANSPSAYAYDANNRITVSPGNVWAFDADGNVTVRNQGLSDEERFTFDETNRLRRYENDDTGVDATYLYDPFGRRLRKSVNGTSTWFLWDRDRLLAEFDGSGDRVRRYTYAGGFAPLELVEGGSGSEVTYAVHTDHLDTPRLLTSGARQAAWRASYQAFGEAAFDAASTVAFNIRFPGQYFDAKSRLSCNRFRAYDGGTGWYLSADRRGRASDSLYAYAANSPLISIDPMGLAPFVNNSSQTVRVSGNPGPGDGTGPQVEADVAPGQKVDWMTPVETPEGPVSDVDFVDFNGDGVVDQTPGLTGLISGEKIPGGDAGLAWGVVGQP